MRIKNQLNRVSRLVLTCLMFASVVTGLELASAQQAEAKPAWAWVYISFPKWLGNCATNGGSVKTVSGTLTPSGTTWNHDYGDDIVYGKVLLNQNNTVVYTGLCYKGEKSAFQPGNSVDFTPTRNGQTIWVGFTGTKMN